MRARLAWYTAGRQVRHQRHIHGSWPSTLALTSPYFLIGCLNSFLLAAMVGLLIRRRELVHTRNIELLHEVEVRRQAELALSESEQRFRQLFDSSPDPGFY